MPDLSFVVEAAEAVPWAAVPQIAFKLRVTNADPDEVIRNVTLQCQIQIEPVRRQYAPEEQKKLLDLFGEPSRWGTTLKTLLWTVLPVNISSFTGSTVVEVLVPCSFDFNVATTKYLHGLDAGEIPLRFLFSGSIFYDDDEGRLQITQISWNCESTFRLSAATWKEMMDFHYPSSAWLCVPREIFERLLEFKTERGIPTWQQALEDLIGDRRTWTN
ncbi:MAG: DUF6084 family protein [Acidobacteriota bacterium]